jgi:hypothetical protein
VASQVISPVALDHRVKALGIAVAGFGPLLAAALLVPLRDDLASANAVLVFAIVVVIASACGGWACGVLSAVVSTMAFDFFLTKPYLSFDIDHSGDVVTAVLLAVIGLIVVALVEIARRSRRARAATRTEVARLQRIAALVADDTETEDVILSVEAELLGLLSLRDCRFEVPPFAVRLPRIERTGSVEGGRRRWVDGELTLPADGAEIPVIGRGHTFGRVVVVGDWDVGVSIEQCSIAVALVDQLGAALASEAGPLSSNEWNLS